MSHIHSNPRTSRFCGRWVTRSFLLTALPWLTPSARWTSPRTSAPANLWLARWDGSDNRALTTGENKQIAPALESRRQDARLSFQPHGRARGRSTLAPADSRGARPGASRRSRAASRISRGRPIPNGSCLSFDDPDPRDPEGHDKDKKTVPPLVIDRYPVQAGHGRLSDGPLPPPAPARPGHAQGRKPHRRQA